MRGVNRDACKADVLRQYPKARGGGGPPERASSTLENKLLRVLGRAKLGKRGAGLTGGNDRESER